MHKSLITRLLLLAAAALLAVLTFTHPRLLTESFKTLGSKEKTEALVPGSVIEQDFTVSGTTQSVETRLETAPSASGEITLQLTLLRGSETIVTESMPLAKKKAKAWLPLTLPDIPAGSYTLRIEVQGEGSVKLGAGRESQPDARLNGEAIPLSLDLQLRGSRTTQNRQLLLLSAALALLALTPVSGRRKIYV